MWFTEPECFKADELAALVTHATGGDLHIVLAPQAVWRSDQARAAANQAIAELYARYAGQPEYREEPDFKAIAELLSRPPEARYGWISDKHSGTKLSVLVAGSSWFGLIAVRVRTSGSGRSGRTGSVPCWPTCSPRVPGEPACRRSGFCAARCSPRRTRGTVRSPDRKCAGHNASPRSHPT